MTLDELWLLVPGLYFHKEEGAHTERSLGEGALPEWPFVSEIWTEHGVGCRGLCRNFTQTGTDVPEPRALLAEERSHHLGDFPWRSGDASTFKRTF